VAVLRHHESKLCVSLAARTLVGRRSHCQMQLEHTSVGREHAVLSFTEDRWRVRDLASQNGTFLDGSRLRPGVEYEFEAGMVLCFGNKAESWEMVKDGPPDPAAVRDDGEIVVGELGTLALPNETSKELELLVEQEHDGMHWKAYRGDRAIAVTDQGTISAGGREWRLLLPGILEVGTSTLQAVTAGTSIILRTNSDESELRGASVVVDANITEVSRPQTAWKLILALAKYRLEHEASGSSADGNWLSVRKACRRAGISYDQFSYTLHRARKYLGKAGAPDASHLIAQRDDGDDREVSLQGCSVTIVHT
jgi:hypothetical protein